MSCRDENVEGGQLWMVDSGRLLRVMAHSTSTYHPSRPSHAGDAGGRVCNLDFRPSRFFGCRVEKVLAEFFSCDDPRLSAMPEAIWDLSQGTVRPGLDDRVIVEATFSPTRGQGNANVTLFYRLPSVDSSATDKVLKLLDRRSTSSGYHRFGTADVASLRGSTRVRTSIVGHDSGESLLVTTLLFALRAIAQPAQRQTEATSTELSFVDSVNAPPLASGAVAESLSESVACSAAPSGSVDPLP